MRSWSECKHCEHKNMLQCTRARLCQSKFLAELRTYLWWCLHVRSDALVTTQRKQHSSCSIAREDSWGGLLLLQPGSPRQYDKLLHLLTVKHHSVVAIKAMSAPGGANARQGGASRIHLCALLVTWASASSTAFARALRLRNLESRHA